MLVLAGFLFPLLLLETVLAVIHDLADRGLSLRGDHYEVHILGLGSLEGFLRAHDAELGAVAVDHTYLGLFNVTINSEFFVGYCRAPPPKFSNEKSTEFSALQYDRRSGCILTRRRRHSR